MATEQKRVNPGLMVIVIVISAAVIAALALWIGTKRESSARNPTAGMTVEQAQQKLHDLMRQQKGK